MFHPFTILKGLILGAAAMYLFDPVRGRRRRALLRDQVVAGIHRADRGFSRGLRDLQNRAQGVMAGCRSALESGVVDDQTLEARVRSRIGRCVSRPRGVVVRADEGHITLSGPVLSREVPELVSAVRSVPGVRDVENELEPRSDAGEEWSGVGGELAWSAAESVHWTPATRLLATAAGSVLMLNCLVRRNPTSLLSGLTGFCLLMSASGDNCRATSD